MNDLVHIQNTDISVKEYRGQRVVTLKDVDMVHERPGERREEILILTETDLLMEKIISLLVRTKFVQAACFLYPTMILQTKFC